MQLRRALLHAAAPADRGVGAHFGSVEMVLQPIIAVSSGELVAAEALARFPGNPDSPVDEVFALAHASGRGAELEAACLRAALAKKRAGLFDGILITVNVSPNALEHPSVRSALRCDLTGVVVEITEHASADVQALQNALTALRRRGALIAIDDASTGYAGLLRLTALRPDFVKLDRGLVTGARSSLEQAAVIEALVSLSRRIGAKVLGEGVESLDDLTALAELDVDFAQGFYVGAPAATVPFELPAMQRACRSARSELLRNETPFATAESPAQTLGSVTAALAASVQPADLEAALNSAAANLSIDSISLSTLIDDDRLQEVSCVGDEVSGEIYLLAEYPATRSTLLTGDLTEAHLQDPLSDPAERKLMREDGIESLLLTPVLAQGRALGLLEFRCRTHRRWTGTDLAQARILAEHVASVLQRMPGLEIGAAQSRSADGVSAAAAPVTTSPRTSRSAR